MALSESRLQIYLEREMNTCTLVDIERQVLYFYEIYVDLINNLMLGNLLRKFLKSDLALV